VRALPEISRVDAGHALPLLLGGAAALLTGVAAIFWFVRLLASRGFYRFAYYAWAVGAGFLAWLYLQGG
jgi:undecaprenyl pyrophosphate phosphatase UppP